MIHAGVVCLLHPVWIFKSAYHQLTSPPAMEVRTCKELLNLFDQVSLHLNQKCISTTKDLGKLQRNHKPPWK